MWRKNVKAVVMHRNGGCGLPMFYLSVGAVPGEVIEAETAWYPDGTQPKSGDPFKCGSCGVVLYHQGWIPLDWVERAEFAEVGSVI